MYISLLVLGAVAVSWGAPTEDPGLSKRLNNGVGQTPAMGFNNWNANLPSSASTALSAASYFVSLGLKDVGYEYINIDDTWSASARSGGKLIPDPTKWPNGIQAVATQIHSLGLKMGLYGDSGTATCSGFPGSQGYETVDAATLASWGIDLWKYDNCNTPSTNSQIRYTTMRNALQASGRNIYYAMCNWGADSVWTWGLATGNSWRVSSDVTNSWSSISGIASSSQGFASYTGPGGFNDLDMLEIGNGGLTNNEERAHFGLWAISKSPLLIGTDLSKISNASLAILKNTDIIAINQDSLGKAASYFQPSGAPAPQSGTLYPYWAGPLSDGVVIGLVAVSGATTLSVNFADVPGLGAGTYSWKEAYSGKTGSGTSVSAVLGTHDMAVFRVRKSGGVSSTSVISTSKASTSTSKVSTSTITSKMSTTTAPPVTTTTMPVTTTTLPPSGGMELPKWSQCGGMGWTGSGTCISGTTCTYSNPWYSQCL